MPNLMETGTAWFLDQLITHASETVTYKRGVNSVSVSAGIAETEADTLTEQGIQIQIRMNDFLIKVDDLIILAVKITPLTGDKIERTVNGKTVTYEVLKLADEKEFRESDRFGTVFRIHTKEILRV